MPDAADCVRPELRAGCEGLAMRAGAEEAKDDPESRSAFDDLQSRSAFDDLCTGAPPCLLPAPCAFAAEVSRKVRARGAGGLVPRTPLVLNDPSDPDRRMLLLTICRHWVCNA